MTHDKVRQDFERDLQPPSYWEELCSWNEAYRDYCKGYQAGRAAERAEIREKLESEETLEKFIYALHYYKGFAPDIGKTEIKAAITKILEVI